MLLQLKTYLFSNKLSVILIIISAVAVSSATYNWYHPQTVTVTKTEYRTQIEEKEVVKIKRVLVPGPKQIVTIEKQAIVDKLGIDPVPGEGKEIIANAEITCGKDDTPDVSVITIMDTTTGESQIIAKEKPLSLFGFPSNIEAGLRYGLSTQTTQQGDLYARWQFLRIGKIFLGAYGEMTTMPEAKAMLEASFKF